MRLTFSRAAVVAVAALAVAACGSQRAAPPAASQATPPTAGQNGPAADRSHWAVTCRARATNAAGPFWPAAGGVA